MVHCISSSEPDSGDVCNSGGSQEIDWTGSGNGNGNGNGSRNNSNSNPTSICYKATEYDMLSGGHGAHISRKAETPTHMAYVESSTVVSGMHFVADTMKTQESVVSSRHFDKDSLKRKHSDTLVVMETRHLHTSLPDDEDGMYIVCNH